MVVPDIGSSQNFLTRTLTRIPGVEHIRSSFALKTVLIRNSPMV
ncbi:Lrp/AsnC ligand binding domain-containing protein [Cupriavidus sp. YR651]